KANKSQKCKQRSDFLQFMNVMGIRRLWPYLCIAALMWVLMLFSGVHATIAGVLGALSTPVRRLYHPAEFSREARKLLDKFDIYRLRDKDFLDSDRLVGVLHTLHQGINQAQAPLQRIEHALHDPIYFFIIPLFAFCNAGVPIDANAISELVSNPVSLGVAAGLLIGKFSGVFVAVWLSVLIGIARLPEDVNFLHICGMGLLAGIGFTMSIFISELAFKDEELLLNNAKIAILVASVFASLLGYTWLRLCSNRENQS
ncbi:MAG: Na+/H+ antiporter NhaA, partial [Cardiobacteriaceae bacterium]|nr:Na+/H+ antiporter NhaA [Cardiobacteriaceae bacterium]